MTQGVIQPWFTNSRTDDDMYVPKYIEDIAKQVLTHYDLKVKSMRLVTAKSDKGGAIWQMDTNQGPCSLKLLHRTPERSLFSIGAQAYLLKQGARVPPFVPTKTGQLYVEAGGKLWIVNKWISPLTQATKVDLKGAQALCYGLGEFHKRSQGYVPPAGAEKASRLKRWPRAYQKILEKIGWFRELAKVYPEMPASKFILKVIDKYEEQARQALLRLEKSQYAALVSRGEPYWGIVHQDYGWSNGQQGPGGIWIIDLDGVAYDLPIRDLRKLITSTMDDMGVWDVKWIKGMIEAYHQANPIDPALYEILLIDMSLPNEFYKNVKDMVYEPQTFLNSDLLRILERLEKSDATKWPALREMANWKGGGKG